MMMLFVFKHSWSIFQSVLICIDLHGSIAAEQLNEYQLYSLIPEEVGSW